LSADRHVDELALWYASDSLQPAERETVEAHLKSCDACRAAMEEARLTVEALAANEQPQAPSLATKQKLMARIDADLAAAGSATQPLTRWSSAAKVAPGAERPNSLHSLLAWWRDWSPGVAAVAVALAIVVFVWNLTLQEQLAGARAELALFTDPGLRIASLPVSGQAQPASVARFYSNPTSTTAILMIFGAKRLNSDQTYEFWLIRNGQPVPAGIFNTDAAGVGRLIVRSTDPIGSYDQAGITVERAGGAQTPNMNALVFVGPIK
jgi:anti-sigma-K factor RskA